MEAGALTFQPDGEIPVIRAGELAEAPATAEAGGQLGERPAAGKRLLCGQGHPQSPVARSDPGARLRDGQRRGFVLTG
jgi:hypothetical protein